MFEFLKKIYEYRFEITIAVVVILLLAGGLYYNLVGEKGTFSNNYYYNGEKQPHSSSETSSSGRQVGESKGEIEARRVLSSIFDRPFGKQRPNFLNNTVTGGSFNLELDCYDEGMKLAVEYNGRQHYDYVPYFHKNKEAFYNQKYRDELKRRMCRDVGITLIEIPYTVKNQDIEKYLIRELRKTGYLK